MNQRRRFFPSTPVQRVPGQRVALEVQMHPDGQPLPAPAPAPSLDRAPAVSWLAPDLVRGWQSDPSSLFVEEEVGAWRLSGAGASTLWVGDPVLVNGQPVPMAAPTWRCVHREYYVINNSEHVIHGVVWDAPADGLSWELIWSHPAAIAPTEPHHQGWSFSATGDHARGDGPLLTVFLGGWWEHAVEHQDTSLTARAYFNGDLVGEITLAIIWAWH